MAVIAYDYDPHDGPQTEAHGIHVDELLYGGAAGGGKSRWARAELVLMCMRIANFKAVIFRRTFPDLERSVVQPLQMEIPRQLGRYNSTKHTWTFFNGSTLELAYLKNENELQNYQGAEYQLICFEEATHFTFRMFTYMKSRLRSAGQVRADMEAIGMRPRFILTANPGGVGHHWVKQRFVDPAPPRTVFRLKPSIDEPNPKTRCYFPAKATDNPSLNPEYHDELNALPVNLRKALRDGDWDVLDGVRFPDWNRQVHVIKPSDLPISWVGYPRAIGIDYGSSAPFAALWGAKLHDNLIVVYRELYKKGLTPREQAELIRDSEAEGERMPERRIPLVLDPAMWARNVNQPNAKAPNPDQPPPGSIADAYFKIFGSAVRKARNERIGGWALIDDQLRVRDDGFPRLLVYDTCVELIRTLPAAPRDKTNPEDIDTHSEDHLPDALRYLVQDLVGYNIARPKSAAEMHFNRSTTHTGRLANAGF